jgi:hypothetical protein
MKSSETPLDAAAENSEASHSPAFAGAGDLSLEAVSDAHPLRAACEQFVATRFKRAYGARVTHFLPSLLGVRDALSRWQAACGYGEAADGPLFVEQYLDRPVEEALTAALGWPVHRARIVEVGNLAAVSAGMARALIPVLARHLQKLGCQWVVFTATRELRNSFRRLGLLPLTLARADPSRLVDGGTSWGRYYEHDPLVMGGKIALGLRAGERA